MAIRFHLARGDGPAAIRALDPLFRGSPGDPATLVLSARTKRLAGETPAALIDFTAALAGLREPKPELWLEANALHNNHAAALADIELALTRIGPAPTLVARALDLDLQLRRPDAALSRLGRLAATAERPEIFLKRRGDLLISLGRAGEARAAYAEALAAVGRLPAWIRTDEPTRLFIAQLTALSAAND